MRLEKVAIQWGKMSISNDVQRGAVRASTPHQTEDGFDIKISILRRHFMEEALFCPISDSIK